MKKRTLLKTMLLALAMMPIGAWADDKTWDFTSGYTVAEGEAMAAATTEWNNDEGTPVKYTYKGGYMFYDNLKVGSTAISSTRGLRFTCTNNRIQLQSGQIQLKAADVQIIIPNLKAGYTVECVFRTSSNSNPERTINATSNLSSTTNFGQTSSNTEQTGTGTVTVDGAVVLTSAGGAVNVKSITVKDGATVLSIDDLMGVNTPYDGVATTSKTWDFTNLSADWTNLETDAASNEGAGTNWTKAIEYKTTDDPSSGLKSCRYNNKFTTNQFQMVELEANSTAISAYQGLKFGREDGGLNVSKLRIDREIVSSAAGEKAQRILLNGSVFDLVIPNLKPGDYVEVDFATSSNGNERSFKVRGGMGTNLSSSASNTKTTAMINITEYNDLILSTTGALYVYAIRLNPSVKLNANGYGTFSSAYDVQIAGASAYKATLDTGNKTITCTKIADGKVPAGAGVLLYGDANATVTLTATTASALSDNDLIGTTKSDGSLMAKDAGKYQYVLSGETFKHFTGTAFTPGKAYFETASAVSAPNFSIEFSDGNTTGISEALNVKSQDDATTPVYNFAGQRVANPTKGLYIVNGKKVVIK